MGNVNVEALSRTGGILIILLIALGVLLYIQSNWQEIKATLRCNCLLWKHPDKTKNNEVGIELAKLDDPQGIDWLYKSLWFLPQKNIKWCYEVKSTDENSGEITYGIMPYNPDEHIDVNSQPSAELAETINWEFALPILGKESPLLEKLAYGSAILMGCASLFGIMVLLDMLGKGK